MTGWILIAATALALLVPILVLAGAKELDEKDGDSPVLVGAGRIVFVAVFAALVTLVTGLWVGAFDVDDRCAGHCAPVASDYRDGHCYCADGENWRRNDVPKVKR